MSFELVVFGLALVANVLLGLLVFIRNPNSWTNRLFFLLVSAMNIWALFNVLSSRSGGSLIMARLVLFWAVVFAFLFFLFVRTYPSNVIPVRKRTLIWLSVLSLCAMAITLSPLAFKEILPDSDAAGLGEPVVGPGIGLFALTVFFFDFGGLYYLVRKVKTAPRSERVSREYLLAGMGLMLLTIIVLNFVFPTALKDTRFIPYASAFMLPFVGFTTYAIIKHRLLDIRAAVARAVTYLLSLFSLGVLYTGLVYIVSAPLSGVLENASYERLFYISIAIATSLFYPKFKTFFNKVTNKIFYQDAYDAQMLLDELNTIIVANIDLQPLLRQCAEVIATTLKTDYCSFVVPSNSKDPNRIIGTKAENPFGNSHEDIIELATKHRKKLIEADEAGNAHRAISKLMTKENIAIISKLGSTTNKDTLLAYLLVGPKKSGNPFNRNDVQVLEIISNELVIAIQNAMRFEEIQAFNVTLQERINEATKKLRANNEKLKELDQSKDEFISMASHQLRTPLTSVKGYVSMVMEGDVGKLSKQQRDLLGQAFASSQRMVYLIADLLNVSRLRTGKFVIENKPTQLDDVIETEIDQLQEAAKTKKQTLTYHRPKKFPLLMLDETKIRQVIMNFTDNAIYYTPAGGHIDVKLENFQNHIEFTVTDDGIGVPKSEQHHMFTKFYRAGNARKARPDGTGLGIFMAKKVIISQGGAVIFHSEEGKGSTFGFSIPKARLEKVPRSAKTEDSNAGISV